MISIRLLAAAALAVVLVACGNSDPKTLIAEGNKALTSGDSAAALEKFNEAVTLLKPTDGQFLDAKMGVIEALIAKEPQRAADELKLLANAQPEKIGSKQFIYVGGQMVSARQYEPAVKLIHEGIQRYSADAPALKKVMERIKQEAANDKGANDLMRSLGYL